MRSGMLGWLGYSHSLIDFNAQTDELFRKHIRLYQEVVRNRVKNGSVSQTGLDFFEAKRDWYAFCYTLPEQDSRLLFLFQLDPGSPVLKPEDPVPERTYQVTWADTGEVHHMTGAELRRGFCPGVLRARESRVLRIDPA